MMQKANTQDSFQSPFRQYFIYGGSIFLLTWVAHFWFFNDFGVYEDDLQHIVRYLDMEVNQFVDFAKYQLLHPFKSGRPLGDLIPAFLTVLGMKLGGFPMVYFLGYLIVACNAFILFLILLDCFNVTIAFPAALLFCLMPADTTEPFLTHCLQLQGSMLFGFWHYTCISRVIKLPPTCFLHAAFFTMKPASSLLSPPHF